MYARDEFLRKLDIWRKRYGLSRRAACRLLFYSEGDDLRERIVGIQVNWQSDEFDFAGEVLYLGWWNRLRRWFLGLLRRK